MANKDKECWTPQKFWESLSSHLVHYVELCFFTLGVIVARNPWKVIILSWCFIFLSSAGLLKFYIEKNPMKLWVPPESDFYHDTYWYIDKFGTGMRRQKLLITADNVLDPQILQLISEITNKVDELTIEYNETKYTMQELCFKVPELKEIVSFYHKNQSDYVDPSLWLDYDFYCSFLDNFKYVCYRENVLDLWQNDANLLNNITKVDIVSKVNTAEINPVTGHPMDYKKTLGGAKFDEYGNIVEARSVLLTWYAYVNMSATDHDEIGNLVGTEDWVSLNLLLWESKYLELVKELSNNYTNIKLYYEAGRSFGDISGETIFSEIDKLFMGIIVMFFYIQCALSRCNWLEVRLTLGGVGLLCVGMAYITAVSWCSIFEVPFGPVHSSLPFLLMGLGVDDMFVMKACWEQLSHEEKQKSLPFKVGLMLKHAGVSIVITSFTDIVALLIGAITILPSLKSFCFYAAAGVFFIFCYSVTFYVAVFTLDIMRIESNRNGVLFCYQHKRPIELSKNESILQRIVTETYKKFFFRTPVKALVIVFTLAITGFSIESMLRLEQRFDPSWFIPDGTYYKDFLDKHYEFYPKEGHDAFVFLGEMNYNKELPKLLTMVDNLHEKDFVQNIDSWIKPFHMYVLKNFDHDFMNSSLSTEKFEDYLSKFLFSPIGGRYQINMKFSSPSKCGLPSSDVLASTIAFKFPRFKGPEEYIPAMNAVKNIVKNTSVTSGDGYRSVWSKAFANWVTDEIISVEVERNIELALLCVMICTVILITNLQMCLWIFICVLLTIINVLGFMQRWGMTVDIVCCIGLELAIGLCVDYSAHVGHTFLTVAGESRSQRAFKTVTSIGTAVLLGGGSTFLSLLFLSMSKAYTFQSFFKIFLLVIVFGLFNGLVFLPTVLSLIGPGPYVDIKDRPLEVVELNGKSKSAEKQYQDDEYTEVPS